MEIPSLSRYIVACEIGVNEERMDDRADDPNTYASDSIKYQEGMQIS